MRRAAPSIVNMISGVSLPVTGIGILVGVGVVVGVVVGLGDGVGAGVFAEARAVVMVVGAHALCIWATVGFWPLNKVYLFP